MEYVLLGLAVMHIIGALVQSIHLSRRRHFNFLKGVYSFFFILVLGIFAAPFVWALYKDREQETVYCFTLGEVTPSKCMNFRAFGFKDVDHAVTESNIPYHGMAMNVRNSRILIVYDNEFKDGGPYIFRCSVTGKRTEVVNYIIDRLIVLNEYIDAEDEDLVCCSK